MRGLLFLMMVLSFVAKSQGWGNIDAVLSQLSKSKIHFDTTGGTFDHIFYEDDPSDDTLRFWSEKYDLSIYTYTYNDSGYVKYNNKRHPITINKPDGYVPVNLDGTGANISQFTFNKKRYYCIVSGGTGMLQSGSSQQIAFFVLIDVTNRDDVKLSCFHGRYYSIYSFGDFDGDGQLDFARITNSDTRNNECIITPYTIKGNVLQEIKNKGKKQLVKLKRVEENFIVTSKVWF